jgi:hypothetical protein
LTLTPRAAADSGWARHKKLYAVPVLGKVTVDAKLDDWDLSGQILMYVVSETSEMQSARFAVMYDSEALYFSGVVRDPSPMMNRHDPNVDPEKAWAADVCQIYLCAKADLGYPINYAAFNPQHKEIDGLIDMYLWYYTDRKEPCLTVNRGMGWSAEKTYPPRGAVPADKFQAAYLKSGDGIGYTFEYRIPWSTMLVKQAPKAGDVIAFTVQFDWSDPQGLKLGAAGFVYDVMAGPGFPYQSSACWGKLIFSEKGALPKDLVEEGAPQDPPMPLTFKYELPEDGEVTLQLFDDRGMIGRTLIASAPRRAGTNIERWTGLDDTGKPLGPGTYAWRGIYHQPLKTKFILSVHNSGQPPYKLDDNTGGWGGDHGTPTTVCAGGDTMVLAWNMCESGWGLIRTNLAGKKLGGVGHNAEDVAIDGNRVFVVGDHGYEGAHSVKIMELPDFRPISWGNGRLFLDAPEGGDEKTNIATAVAFAGAQVYASWTERGLIGVYDAQTGNLKESWAVPSPHRLAARADGTVFVISEGKLLAVKQGKAEGLVSDHLDCPTGVCLDAQGQIYVANAGKLQNVSVFSSDGKFLRSIGKEGGRPRVGNYDKTGTLEPGGITVDKNGRLWVAERLDSPKRHSVWDTKTGSLVSEFFGSSSYFGWAYMDPKRSDEVYCHNVLWKVDLGKGTYEPVSTIWRATGPNVIYEANPGGYAGHFRVMTARNGKQFGWGMSDYSNMLYMREGNVFKPIAGTIRVAFGPYGGGLRYPAMKDYYEANKKIAYLWQDTNDDQTVQVEELMVSPGNYAEWTFNWMDPDLTAWCDAGFVFKPVRFEPDGRPVYDFSKRDPVPFKGGNSNATTLVHDPEDKAAYILIPGGDPGFARYTEDGKLVWGYRGIIPWPNALSLPVVKPGRLWGLTMQLGIAGDFTGAATYFGPYHIFTRDGLYVGMIMRDGRTGGLGPDITASEVVTGQLVKPEGMDRYFLLAGDQDGRVTEVLGLDTVKRLPSGTYVHTEDAVKQTVAALAEFERLKAKGVRLDIVRGRPALEVAKGVGKTVDEARRFTARAAYDEKDLYVSFEVMSPAEMTNDVSDPRLVFKGGNCIDIQIAVDPAADPKRKTPAPGDMRLLVTRQKGKPMAVIYRPKVQDFAGEPIVLTSPTGKESFDAIAATDAVGIDYRKITGGFQAVVTVPLSLLGWVPKPGTEVRMDLGYLFGNSLGTQVAVRSYWTNNGFSANVTNDIPNESRLEPAEWGTALVE